MASGHGGGSLKDALDLLSNALAEERDPVAQRLKARAALEALPESVDPLDAMALLRRMLPASFAPVLHALLETWWTESGKAPVLAALAGLWQWKQPNGRPGPGLNIALRDGDASILTYLVGAIDRHFDDLDEAFGTGVVLTLLEAASDRTAADAALTQQLAELAKRVEQRTRLVMLARVQRLIAEIEDEPEDHDGRHLALALRLICLPRFPELLAEANAAFERHDEVEWRIGAIDFDLMMVERASATGDLGKLDMVAIWKRLRDGEYSTEPALSAAAMQARAALGELGVSIAAAKS